MLQRFFIISLFKSMIIDEGIGTRAVFFKQLCWSFYWLYLGLDPTHDADMNELPGVRGSELAGGWRACLFALCDDLEALAEELGLKNSNRTDGCNWCEADESTMPWIHCHKGAKWLNHVWKGRAWLARMRPANALFNLIGVTIAITAPDWMHNKHLGTDQYVYGSVAKYTICYLMPGTIEENEAVFFTQLNKAYQDVFFLQLPFTT
jgi:hypothetical protein